MVDSGCKSNDFCLVFTLFLLYISLYGILQCDAEQNCCNFAVRQSFPLFFCLTRIWSSPSLEVVPKSSLRGLTWFSTAGIVCSVKTPSGALVCDEILYTPRCCDVLHVGAEVAGGAAGTRSQCVCLCCSHHMLQLRCKISLCWFWLLLLVKLHTRSDLSRLHKHFPTTR